MCEMQQMWNNFEKFKFRYQNNLTRFIDAFECIFRSHHFKMKRNGSVNIEKKTQTIYENGIITTNSKIRKTYCLRNPKSEM